MTSRHYYIIGGLVALALLFQLFFRYGYVRQNNAVVWRVDRLAGSTCVMPCTPPPTPQPTPEPTPFNLVLAQADFTGKVEAANQRAIAIARTAPNAVDIVAHTSAEYIWKAEPSNIFLEMEPTEKAHGFLIDPVRLVCYCSVKNFGWRWEVHTDTGLAYYINDNGELMKKYGLDATPPPFPGNKKR